VVAFLRHSAFFLLGSCLPRQSGKQAACDFDEGFADFGWRICEEELAAVSPGNLLVVGAARRVARLAEVIGCARVFLCRIVVWWTRPHAIRAVVGRRNGLCAATRQWVCCIFLGLTLLEIGGIAGVAGGVTGRRVAPAVRRWQLHLFGGLDRAVNALVQAHGRSAPAIAAIGSGVAQPSIAHVAVPALQVIVDDAIVA